MARPLNIGSVVAPRLHVTFDQFRTFAGIAGRLEVVTVAVGMRPAGYQLVHEDDLPSFLSNLKGLGLFFDFVLTCKAQSGFLHGYAPPQPGCPKMYGFAFSHDPRLARALAYHLARGDDERAGRLLGYPDCCIEAFARREVEDPLASYLTAERLEASYFSSPFLRRLGGGLTFHFPCRLDCPRSVDLGRQHFELLSGEEREALWAQDWVELHVLEDGVFWCHTPWLIGLFTTSPGPKGVFRVRHFV